MIADIEKAQTSNCFVGQIEEEREDIIPAIELFRNRESIILNPGEKIGKVKVSVSADGYPLREKLFCLAEGQNLIITDFEHTEKTVRWGAWGFYKIQK